MYGHEPDEALLRRIAAGDARAVRAMVERKLSRLLRLAQRLLRDRTEAEDVVQETFLRLWKQAPEWREGEARLDTWLYRVAFNLCTDRLRKRRETYVAEVPDMPDPGHAPDHGLDERDRQRWVAGALDRLPERQREAIVLQYYEELSNAEAADIMGTSLDALESLLSRARRNLRDLLGGSAGGDLS